MPGSPDLPIPAASPPPPDLACFGRPPLVPGEQTAAYEALQAAFSAALRPRDVLEQAWVRETGDLIWERLRLRRHKAALMTACADEGMQRLLKGLGVRGDFYDLARRWAARDLAAVGQVEAVLNTAGLGIEHVMAQTLRHIIGEFAQVERMIAANTARQAAILREIDFYRTHFGAEVRRVVQEVEQHAEQAAETDAAFAVVAPPIAPPSPQASQAAEAAA